jgi:hypothetical protein
MDGGQFLTWVVWACCRPHLQPHWPPPPPPIMGSAECAISADPFSLLLWRFMPCFCRLESAVSGLAVLVASCASSRPAAHATPCCVQHLEQPVPFERHTSCALWPVCPRHCCAISERCVACTRFVFCIGAQTPMSCAIELSGLAHSPHPEHGHLPARPVALLAGDRLEWCGHAAMRACLEILHAVVAPVLTSIHARHTHTHMHTRTLPLRHSRGATGC